MKPLGNLFDIVPVIVPLDLQTARSGDYVSLKNAQGVCFVVFKGVGTAADDPDFTVQQASDVAGTGAKDVTFTQVYKKQGTLTAVGSWTSETQAASATYSADGTSAEEQAVYVIQIDADELDVDNGFDCVTMNAADVGGNAQLGCVLAILYGLRQKAAPENLPNSIAD